jgi:hypothetical protein
LKIILDENVPSGLCPFLAPHLVTTVQLEGLSGFHNGESLSKLEGAFDIFITADKNLRYQQNLSRRAIAIVELPTNRWPEIREIQSKILEVIDDCQPGTYRPVSARLLPP